MQSGQKVVSERLLLRPDGTRVPVEMSSRRMPDGTYQTFMHDVTGRQREEQERAALRERLRAAERVEAIGRLAGGIAHDFNNLLTPILGAASLLRRDPALPAHRRADVEAILEAAERAAELTRQILALGRRQVLRQVPLDLNAEIARTERMLRRMVGEDVQIRLALAPALPPVRADVSQLQQVLVNLVVNARDALPRGGTLELRTSAFTADEEACRQVVGLRPGRHVRLDASDDGEGMDEATLRQVFDPFFTTKEQGRGTGLGLATVRGIVEQHGGAIWATSAPGRGATFTICLPLADGEPTAPQEAAPTVRTRGTELILLAEDDPLVRGAARRILEEDGYSVRAAGNAAEALRLAGELEHQPALLLTDVIMPGMDGRELSERLRDRFPSLRTLFISGYPDSVLAPRGVLAGPVRFLGKPFTAAALSAAVRAALDER